MAALRDELTIESSTLLSVSTHIVEFLRDRRSERTYLAETNLFFNFAQGALESLHGFVGEVIARPQPVSDTTTAADLRDVKAFQVVLSHLYRFVRQVADADTLTIPFPIIVHINQLMEQFPDSSPAKNARIVLLATDELNFLHRRLDALRAACKNSCIVPEFPGNMGLVAFPYTERRSVCLNSLLFHELGHFVYQKCGHAESFKADLGDLDGKLDAITRKEGMLFGDSLMKSSAHTRVLSWAEEIFADLLAVVLIGPSYAIAFDRLVRLKGSSTQLQNRFTDAHPADSFRKGCIARLLDEMGWIAAVEKVDGAANAILLAALRADAAAKPAYEYPIENLALSKVVLDSFVAIVPKVLDGVNAIASHLPNPLEDFAGQYGSVTRSLLHLVVPGVARDREKLRIVPSPATMLICGSLLLRRDLEELFVLCGRDKNDIWDRVWIEERISRLVLKAMEDALVFQRWENP